MKPGRFNSIQESNVDESTAALTFLGEIVPPADTVWVEFDYRELMVARVERGSPSIVHQKNPSGSGLRGYLVDNRDVDAVRVTMFSGGTKGVILDPFLTLYFDRTAQGLNSFKPYFHSYMADILAERGVPVDELKGRSTLQLADAATDLFIPYALFAMLVSPDLGGIIPTEKMIYTPKEVKTARKFGKPWIVEAQKSHLTIRIGPQAAAHMQEQIARLEFEKRAREDRNSPIRHWVSEHERHYRSGKIVLIKGHHRGQMSDYGLPTRVMGPRSRKATFIISTDD